MDIGIFGGSFNPIHTGHLIVAEEVFQQRALSKVIFVPTCVSPHKEPGDLIDAFHRYQMVKDAISDNEHFEVSDIEIRRSGRSYTVDTIRNFKSVYGEKHNLFLIVGTDMINEIGTWKDVDILSGMCRFIVVNRFPVSENLTGFQFDSERSGESKGEKPGMEVLKVRIPPIGISSTEIRERLYCGRSVKYLVPQCVEDYIRANNLYRKGKNS